MEGHIHLSVISVTGTVAVLIIASFLLHQASLKLGASQNENMQLWGKALAAGFGF